MKSTIILVSLAGNQSSFFAALEPHLQAAGHSVVHICFHEQVAEQLRARGHRVFNAFERAPETPVLRFEDFGIEEHGFLLGHEKAAYELRDTAALATKFRRHLGAVDAIFYTLRADGRPLTVVQELGGFTSVLATYYAARRHDIANYFIEPSFFKGRVFFTLNTFRSPLVRAATSEVSDIVRDRLEEIRINQTVAIPTKDRSHYRGAFKKLTDARNIRRLGEKLFQKYIAGKQEEFNHVGGHVSRHLRMLWNSMRLRKHFASIPNGAPFIYYPLHVPADFALTLRSPEYLDQLSLIDYLCRIAPLGHKVVIKEHPALVGSMSAARVDDLMARHDNLVLLRPTINNHRVLQEAECVVTVNSKAGAEALLYRKPVIALGDSFYRASGLVTPIESIKSLRTALRSACPPDMIAVETYFENVWQASWPGELYDLAPDNVETFAMSLIAHLAPTPHSEAGHGGS